MTQREQQILCLIEANPMISQQELADALNITRSSVAVHISNLLKKGYIAGKGYVLRTGSYAVVVGGVNVDIGGQSHRRLVPEDSNPGRVSVSLGGVGRNIAHNMTLMGTDVRMLTAIGEDLHGSRVASSCAELGIDISHALRVSDCPTSTYLYVADEQGEMAVAISDMEICNRITPAYLAANLPLLQSARVVVADTNIPEESLVYLAENCTAPLFCDPVSTIKAEKLRSILNKIHTLKPNRLEAELLSGIPIETKADAETAARVLLGKGIKRVFISMGADGVCAAEEDRVCWLSNIPGRMVNTTGCGDAFMAALVWAYMEDMELEAAARAGLAAGSIAMESKETINPAMSATALKTRMDYKSIFNIQRRIAMNFNKYLDVNPEVAQAIAEGKPVVALESTIISHGMPYPQNVQTALEVERIIRENGAVPATIAIIGGRLKAGLTAEEIEYFGKKGLNITKASRRDLAVLCARGEDGATTVTTTMIIAHMAGIKIFATGGIGGVHRGAETTMDISADLEELGQTPVMVVCAGAKSILDLGLTLEYLETKGVPVIGYGTEELPAFYTRKSGFKVDYRIDTPEELAAAFKAGHEMGLKSGMLVTNPIPEEYAMPLDVITAAIDQAVGECEAKGIHGKQTTPFLLARVAELTGGNSLASNIQLVFNNAKLAAQTAVSYCNN